MGNDEPVTPVFPNSDYCTGIIGVAAVLDAVARRGSIGGSYQVDVGWTSSQGRNCANMAGAWTGFSQLLLAVARQLLRNLPFGCLGGPVGTE